MQTTHNDHAPSDPFLSHILALLSAHEQRGTATYFPPTYDGPTTPDMEAVLRAIIGLGNRMETKETGARAVQEDPLLPAEQTLSANTEEQQLKLVKAQIQDIGRVCDAVARGDLSQKITIPVQGAAAQGALLNVSDMFEMGSLINTINGMVDQLALVAAEVKKVAHEVGTAGNLGAQAEVDNAQGTWQELTLSLNTMSSNLARQVGSFVVVSQGVLDGDYTLFTTVAASGEMDLLKTKLNQIVHRYRQQRPDEVGEVGKSN